VLILKRASASSSGHWSDEDFDVLCNGAVVGRIFKANAAPVESPWMWTLIFPHHEDRTPTHGYEATPRGRDGGLCQELAAQMSDLSTKSLGRSAPLGPQKHACDVAAGRAFIPDQARVACDGGNPDHLVHNSFASWTGKALAFRDICHAGHDPLIGSTHRLVIRSRRKKMSLTVRFPPDT